MVNKLIKLMQSQEKDLQELLRLLEVQYSMIMNKDVFGLEGLVDKINECGKEIAKEEVERRNLIGEESLSEIISTSDDENLKKAYKDIQTTLKKVITNKDTNDLLIKQQLMFTNKMLNIMNPDREIKTYNSYGNLKNTRK